MTPNGSAQRVALVTGAGHGIGRAIATRLASDGYAVACVDIDERSGTAVADSLGAGGLGASSGPTSPILRRRKRWSPLLWTGTAGSTSW